MRKSVGIAASTFLWLAVMLLALLLWTLAGQMVSARSWATPFLGVFTYCFAAFLAVTSTIAYYGYVRRAFPQFPKEVPNDAKDRPTDNHDGGPAAS